MTVYTVHEPPVRSDDVEAEADRFVFVRDGFYMWAFLLAPLWLLRYRLWIAFAGYVALIVALQTAFWLFGASSFVKFAVGILLSLLIGLEAASLRRWTLGRRKWKNLGVVVAADLESAERRFFDQWVTRTSRSSRVGLPPAGNVPPVPVPMRMPASDDVIGLFPEPEPRPRS